MLLIFLNRWKKLFLWILVNLFLYLLMRMTMYIYHYDYFHGLTFSGLLKILIGGARFDLVSVSIANTLLIFYFLLPISFSKYSWLTKLILYTNLLINIIFLLFNTIDIPYFSFIHKRSTADIFYQMGGQTDVMKQLPEYLKDFWGLIILFFVSCYIYFLGLKKIFFFKEEFRFTIIMKNIITLLFHLIFSAGLTILAIRGGLQRIPLDIIDAGFYAESNYTALVLNTPFSIIKSFEQNKLKEYSFYSDKEIIKSLKLVKTPQNEPFTKRNIVVIILESFSKEYTKLGQTKSFTPFLDSLMQHSIVFENAWANGTKSIEGIPAIIASVPSFMENPFINSLYCNNYYESLANLLKREKYYTAFFHGGINGTMNFDAFAKQTGFNEYIGKNEYPNNMDFDGFWGIWDEPFLQYTCQKISKYKEPFFVSVFTLSSHHPFKVPHQYESILPKGELPIQQCIAYTDYALKKFFDSAKEQKWYNNTLFVITADHTGLSQNPYYSSIAGRYQIPLLFFDVKMNKQQVEKSVIQQIDIMPTVLSMIHYPHRYFSFGSDYFNETTHTAMIYETGQYYLVTDSLFISFINFTENKSWHYQNNTLIEVPITNTNQMLNNVLKMKVQAYNNRLIKNDILSILK